MRISYIVLAMMFFVSSLMAQDARSIIRKMDSVSNAVVTKKVVFTMELVGRDGKKSVRKGLIYETNTKRRLVKFTGPANIKDIAFLSLPGDLMYVYLPSFRKIRRIATSVKNTNFAGTDFTYDELSTFKYSKKYRPTLLAENDTAWVLKLIPVNKGDYDHLVMYVYKKHYIPFRIEFYDMGGNLWKVLEQKRIRKVKNYYVPTLLSMEDVKKKHKTGMEIKNIELDVKIPKKVFTKRYLRR